jgi:hypothetical protein
MPFVGSLSGSTGLSIGLTGSVILANPDEVGATFPGLPGTDVDFFISGAIGPGEGAVTVLGGEVVASGSIVVENVVEAQLGLSGSLTRLSNGNSFIEAGSNVTVTSASNGAVTIAATGGGSTNAAGSDTQIQYNNGGTDFGGIADLTWDDTDITVGASSGNTKLKFRDATIYAHSPADGVLEITSDILATVTGTLVGLTGSAASANAVRIHADDASGGIDVDSGTGGYNNTTTGKIHLTASLNSGDASAIQMLASAGGIMVDAVGAAGEDIDITNTGGSINITATEDVATAVTIVASTGGIDITADGAAGKDLDLTCTDGSVNITAGEAIADALVINVSGNGGMDLTVGNAANDANANLDMVVRNKLNIDAQGTDSGDGVEITLGADDANVKFNVRNNNGDAALTADGLLDVSMGRNMTVAGASTFVGNIGCNGIVTASMGLSGSLTRLADGKSFIEGGTNITVTSASNGAVTIASTAGGSVGGSDTQYQYNNGGAFGGAADLTFNDSTGDTTIGASTGDAKLFFRDTAIHAWSPADGVLEVISDLYLYLTGTTTGITGSTASANAVRLHASDAAGGIDVDSGTGGYNNTTTGKIHLTASLNSGDASAIQMLASAGGIDVDAVGAAGEDINITNTGGSVNISATEDIATAVTIVATTGGIDITADGAAGKDLDLTCTDGSVNITGGENDAASVVITGVGVQIKSSDTSNGLALATQTSAVPISIGHTTSETTVNDNLTVTGDFTVNGTTTIIDTTNLKVADPIILLGTGSASADSNGGIAIVSGSNTAANAMVFGRVDDDVWGVGRKDVEDGAVTSVDDMTLTSIRAAKFQVAGANDYIDVATNLRLVAAADIFLDPGGGDVTADGNVLPNTDISYDLGSASKRWRNIYTGDLHLANERGNWTVIEESDFLTLRNNNTGKRFKILMEMLPDDGE